MVRREIITPKPCAKPQDPLPFSIWGVPNGIVKRLSEDPGFGCQRR
tara:strand:+ start:8719 stop:8856 length:138 start_codon:yes stop_codon:yes gene_type:complete